MYELSLTPAAPGHSINAESVELYVSDTNEKGSYHKVEATVSIDDASGRISVKPSQAILTRYAKVHCILDTRDENLKAAQARFTNLAAGILRIGYYAQKTDAYYGYDKQGNRVSSSITKGEAGLGLSATLENALYRYWGNSDRVKLVEKTTTEQDGLPVTSTWAYTYDALGNLAEKGDTFVQNGTAIDFLSDSGHYVRYEYDLWNRLAAVWKGEAGTASATQAATYEYDPTGLRIRKISTTARTEYVYGLDGNVLKETRDEAAGDDVAIDYVYALGKLVGWTETIAGASVKYWATSDHLGSVTAATDANGNLAMRRDYSAFGDSKDAILETAAGPRYTGKDYDEDAERYYFNARWYDAELGRFTTEDPIRDGTNWYAYVNNGPLNYTDPTGMYPVEDNTNESLNRKEREATRLYMNPTAASATPFADSIKKAAEEHLGETYVTGTNDCDIWIEKVLKEAGKDITNIWGKAVDNSVKRHKEILGSQVAEGFTEGVSVVFQDEGHVGLIIENRDGSVDLYHQGWNNNSGEVIWQSQHYYYDDASDWNDNGWSGSRSYYSVKPN